LLPKLIPRALPVQAISRVPAVRFRYDNDPLVPRQGMCVRWGYEALKACDQIQGDVKLLTIPLLVMQGSDDKIVNPAGAKFLADNAPSDDKTLKWYQGAFHEIFNDIGHELVLDDLSKWLSARTTA